MKPKFFGKWFLTAAILSSFIFGLSATTGCISKNPATGKSELMLIGSAQEVALGKGVAKSVETKYRLSNAPLLNQRAQNVFTRIVKTVDRQDIKYSIKVLDTKMVNAFACPGGYLFVTKGMLDFTKNDDELACIIGHEFGHVVARHSVKALQRQIGYGILVNILANSKNKKQLASVAAVGANLVLLGYSRKNEHQSDYLGMRYAKRAGYNPAGAITFFKKLQTLQKTKLNSLTKLLSTHPPTHERIARCEEHLKANDLESTKKKK